MLITQITPLTTITNTSPTHERQNFTAKGQNPSMKSKKVYGKNFFDFKMETKNPHSTKIHTHTKLRHSVSLVLTLNRCHLIFWCFHCWLWSSKFWIGVVLWYSSYIKGWLVGSKMKNFAKIFIEFQPLTGLAKHSILDRYFYHLYFQQNKVKQLLIKKRTALKQKRKFHVSTDTHFLNKISINKKAFAWDMTHL